MNKPVRMWFYTKHEHTIFWMVRDEEEARLLATQLMALEWPKDVVTFDKNDLNSQSHVFQASEIDVITW